MDENKQSNHPQHYLYRITSLLVSGQIFFKMNLIILHKTTWYINDRLFPYFIFSQLGK